jgi:hypothetical protein
LEAISKTAGIGQIHLESKNDDLTASNGLIFVCIRGINLYINPNCLCLDATVRHNHVLFTDIEGSTPLWESMPQAMKAALARHNAILRQAIEANAENAFKTIDSTHDQPDEVAINARNLSMLRARLGEKTFAAAWQEGMQMALKETIIYALEEAQVEIDSENQT